jgi:hypothetical protein
MDATTLHQALAATGLPVIGCDSLGNVQYSRALSTAEMQTATAIINEPHPTLAEARTAALTRLNTDWNQLTFRFFDIGSLIKIQARYSRIIEKKAIKNQTITSKEEGLKAQCESVDAWGDAAGVYYYNKKDALLTAATIAAVEAITWDFVGLFGATGTQMPVPAVNVREFFTA